MEPANITLEEVPYEALYPFVYLGFGEDRMLFEKYAHRQHKDVEEMIAINMQAIKEAIDSGHNIRCYAVKSDGHLAIGFTVLMEDGSKGNLLYSFGIGAPHRAASVKRGWIDAINRQFEGQPYAVVLYRNNTRAADFFERHGFTDRTETPENIVLWQYQ